MKGGIIIGTILEYKGFEASVKYSKNDQMYYGEVLHIKDFLYFSGETREELVRMFHRSIDNYLEYIETHKN